MSGVWVFRNGVNRLVDPLPARRVLVKLPTEEVITSYSSLEQILESLGWEKQNDVGDTNLIHFQKSSSTDLILSLPPDFSLFTSVHMYDVVAKNPGVFHVRDSQ